MSPRCFAFSELPWYQRKVAAIIFSSPPTSTYEEVRAELLLMFLITGSESQKHLDENLPFCHFQALEFFLKAEEGKTACSKQRNSGVFFRTH